MSESRPEIRVGDRERRVVDDALMAAVGDGVLTLAEYDERAARLWSSRTRGELDELVADLPTSRPPAPVARQDGPAPAPLRVVAVMSEESLHAPVLLNQVLGAYAVMGTVVLDLRYDDLPAEVRVLARAVMGEVEVRVPHGARVHLTGGASVMGERKVDLPVGNDDRRGLVVHLDAVAIMGSVVVTHAEGKAPPQTWSPAGSQVATVLQPRRPGRGRRLVAALGGPLLTLAMVGGVAGVVASGTDGRAVFGSEVSPLAATQTSASVSVLFGSVQVVVPDGSRVDTGGLVVFGSTSCVQACLGDGPVVELRSLGGFGSVQVLTQSEFDVLRYQR